jgi:hypothetical protein
MRFIAKLRAAWRAQPATITHVAVTYRGAFPVSVTQRSGHVEVDLAWSSKTETATTDTGLVWSTSTSAGPDIDRVVLAESAGLPVAVSDIEVTYPVWLGGTATLVSSEPGSLVLTDRR